MSVDRSNLRFRPVRIEDLELILAWRSNPEIYTHFRDQQGPLDWSEHLLWFASRSDERFDYVIEYHGRRIGSVFLTEDRETGVYIGEQMLWGRGIGKLAVNWLCERHGGDQSLFATIHEENERSKDLFRSCGFSQEETDGSWVKFTWD